MLNYFSVLPDFAYELLDSKPSEHVDIVTQVFLQGVISFPPEAMPEIYEAFLYRIKPEMFVVGDYKRLKLAIERLAEHREVLLPTITLQIGDKNAVA